MEDLDLTGVQIPFKKIGLVELRKRLGGGTYGDVFEAVSVESGEGGGGGGGIRKGRNNNNNNNNNNATRYAVKYYKDETRNVMTDGVSSTTIRELSAVQGNRHPNLVRMEDIYLDTCSSLRNGINKHIEKTSLKNPNLPPPDYFPLREKQIFVCAAYEFCAGGDLESVIKGSRRSDMRLSGLSIDNTKHFAFQILNGLAYLHNSKMAHRDLKPANLMLDEKGVLKIGDLGLCREIRTYIGEITPTVCTIYYRPLEVLLGKIKLNNISNDGRCHNTNCNANHGEQQNENEPSSIFYQTNEESNYGPHYGLSIDMWSVGCIVCEMILGYPIFKGTTEFELFMRITQILGTPNETEWINCTNLEYWPYKNACTPSSSSSSSSSSSLRANTTNSNNAVNVYHNFDRRDKMSSLSAYLFGKLDTCGLDLLLRMFHYNPHLRITPAEALAHPWFDDVCYKRLDGVGVKNWYTEVLKLRIGKKLYDLLEEKQPNCLETSELSHVICHKNYKGNLLSVIDDTFLEIQNEHNFFFRPFIILNERNSFSRSHSSNNNHNECNTSNAHNDQVHEGEHEEDEDYTEHTNDETYMHTKKEGKSEGGRKEGKHDNESDVECCEEDEVDEEDTNDKKGKNTKYLSCKNNSENVDYNNRGRTEGREEQGDIDNKINSIGEEGAMESIFKCNTKEFLLNRKLLSNRINENMSYNNNGDNRKSSTVITRGQQRGENVGNSEEEAAKVQSVCSNPGSNNNNNANGKRTARTDGKCDSGEYANQENTNSNKRNASIEHLQTNEKESKLSPPSKIVQASKTAKSNSLKNISSLKNAANSNSNSFSCNTVTQKNSNNNNTVSSSSYKLRMASPTRQLRGGGEGRSRNAYNTNSVKNEPTSENINTNVINNGHETKEEEKCFVSAAEEEEHDDELEEEKNDSTNVKTSNSNSNNKDNSKGTNSDACNNSTTININVNSRLKKRPYKTRGGGLMTGSRNAAGGAGTVVTKNAGRGKRCKK